MLRKICLLLSFIQLLVHCVYCNSPTLKQTSNGPVEGIELISSLGQKYYAFRGIPFAEPPITGIDPYTGEEIDRRFKVRLKNQTQRYQIISIYFFHEAHSNDVIGYRTIKTQVDGTSASR